MLQPAAVVRLAHATGPFPHLGGTKNPQLRRTMMSPSRLPPFSLHFSSFLHSPRLPPLARPQASWSQLPLEATPPRSPPSQRRNSLSPFGTRRCGSCPAAAAEASSLARRSPSAPCAPGALHYKDKTASLQRLEAAHASAPVLSTPFISFFYLFCMRNPPRKLPRSPNPAAPTSNHHFGASTLASDTLLRASATVSPQLP